MKKYQFSLSFLLIATMLFSPLGQLIGIGEKEEPLAIVNGKEFYGSLRSGETKEDVINNINNDFSRFDGGRFGKLDDESLKKNYEKNLKYYYDNHVRNELLTSLMEEEYIKKGYITEEETKSLPDKEYWDKIIKARGPSEDIFENIDETDLNKFIEENKDNYMEIRYSYYSFENKEDAEKYFESINTKEYKEALKGQKIEEGKEETILDIYNNTLYRENLSRIKNKSIKSEIYTNTSGGGTYNIKGLSKDNSDPIKDILDDIIKSNRVGEPIEPKVYKTLGSDYIIFIVESVNKLDNEDMKRDYVFNKVDIENNKKLEKLDIKIIYPKVKIEDIFKNPKVNVAKVNGVEVGIRKNNYDHSKDSDDNILEYYIKDAIINELQRQDMEKRGYKLPKDIEDIRYGNKETFELYSKYYEEVSKEYNITDEEIDNFISQNRGKLLGYRFSTFAFRDDFDFNEIYNRLKENNNGYTITKLFEDVFSGEEKDLTKEEIELLKSFKVGDGFDYRYNSDIDGMRVESSNKSFNKLPNDFNSLVEKERYELIKNMKPKEISEPKKFGGEDGFSKESIVLYKIDNSDEMIRLRAEQYLRFDKENNYFKNLFENADIKYYELD